MGRAMASAVCALLLVAPAQAYDPFQANTAAPWERNTSRRFHPLESMSFAHVLFDGFDLKYADTADLRGYIGQDIVQLGHYYARTKFGCITRCDSADFNGVDGILGMGMPDAALASIPEPVIFAITDDTGDPVSQRILKDRKWTFVVDDDAGELQLGAYDHRAIAPGQAMHFFKTTSTAEFSVPVTSIRYGDKELLNFATVINPRVPGRMSWIPGIIDSGTSCVVLPDSLLSGVLREKPLSKFVALFFSDPLYDKTRRLPLQLSIGHGKGTATFDIPFDAWWLESDDRPCIQASPPGFMGILLGDVVFRALVIQFDLTHPTVPIIGLGQRNRHYRPVRWGSNWAHHKPRHDNDFGIPEGFDDGNHLSSGVVDKVPLDTGISTQIFVNVSVGTPRQPMKVILDTGSSVFAVFCDRPPKKDGPHLEHIYLPHFIPSFPHKEKNPLSAFELHRAGVPNHGDATYTGLSSVLLR